MNIPLFLPNIRPSRPSEERAAEREQLVTMSHICEEAQRFEDMAATMRELCQRFDDLTAEERDLLSCAHKNIIGPRRKSLKILKRTLDATMKSEESNDGSSLYDKSDDENSPFTTKTIKSLIRTIESELRECCNQIIKILITRLIPAAPPSGEPGIFYHKMKGDYLRYLCEICSGNEKKEKANESLMSYKTASDRATIELPSTHPVRLGLMLNYSVFLYEIMNFPERSCRLAKQAFDDAIAELDTLSEDSYREATIIMQILRDNLNLWESNVQTQIPAITSPSVSAMATQGLSNIEA